MSSPNDSPMDILIRETFKSADEVLHRLFGHQPFTQGELRFFVKEFEEKTALQDLYHASHKLKSSHSSLTSVEEELKSNHLDSLEEKIESVTHKAEDILSSEAGVVDRFRQKDEDREERYLSQQREFNETVSMGMRRLEGDYVSQINALKERHSAIEEQVRRSISTDWWLIIICCL